jgi:ketosteroid isomerase-like protein
VPPSAGATCRPCASCLTPTSVWHAPGRSQSVDDHRGVDAVRLNSVHAERAGTTLEDSNSLVFHVRDGNVTEVWQHWADQPAADELLA